MDQFTCWIFRFPFIFQSSTWLLFLVIASNEATFFCSLFHGECLIRCDSDHYSISINATKICDSPYLCCVPSPDEPTSRRLSRPDKVGKLNFNMWPHMIETSSKTTTTTTTLNSSYPGITPSPHVCGVVGHSRVRRVVNGVVPGECKYPWMVLIDRGTSLSDTCGATLVSNRHIITAAHCFDKLHGRRPAIVIGEYDRRFIKQEYELHTNQYSYTLHPDYIPHSLLKRNDIAVVTLETPLDLSQYECLRPICLPEVHTSLPVGTQCAVAGWGWTAYQRASNVLRSTFIKVVDPSKCQNAWDGRFFNDSQLCAGDLSGNTDSCEGDSGGPLMCHTTKGSLEVKDTDTYFLFGIVSLGVIQCAQRDVPAVYTDVRKFMPWINKTMMMT